MKTKPLSSILHWMTVAILVAIGLVWIVIGSAFFATGLLISALVVSPYRIGHLSGHNLLIEALEVLKRGKPKQGS